MASEDKQTGTFDPQTGDKIGDYEIQREIGAGGMGTVYLAKDASLGDRLVAIKILKQELQARPDVVERFQQEAKAASCIAHPNIIQIIKFGQVAPGGVLFMVTEYLEGQSLAEIIAREWPIHPQRIARIMGQMLGALAAAHQQGVIHRDLKPENVFILQREGQPDFVKLLDFGIVKLLGPSASRNGGGPKLTQEGMILGTPEYMSPEQIMGEQVAVIDHRSDIYAAGVILYEMLAGCTPFVARSQSQIMSGHLEGHLIPPRKINQARSLKLQLECKQLRAEIEFSRQRGGEFQSFVAALEERVAAVESDLERVNARLKVLPLLDPMIERVAETALAKSPAQRFASALAMKAALDEAIPYNPFSFYRTSQLPPPPATTSQPKLRVATPHHAEPAPPVSSMPTRRHIDGAARAARKSLGEAPTVTPADEVKAMTGLKRPVTPGRASRYLGAFLVFVAALALSVVILPPNSNSEETAAAADAATTRETTADVRPTDAAAEATSEATVKHDVVYVPMPVFVPTPPSRDAEVETEADAGIPETEADAENTALTEATEEAASIPPTPPADYETHMAHGEEAKNARNWRQAAVEFKAATEDWPEGAPAWRELGNALLSLFRRDEGEAAIRQYLELAPNAADAPYFRSLIGEEQ